MNSVSHLETYKITKHPVAKLNEEGDGAGKVTDCTIRVQVIGDPLGSTGIRPEAIRQL